jgi:two-component system, OmpR family, response regulator
MKILLVEDEERLARSVVRGLTEEGHTVDLCGLGDDAIAQGAAIAYDVVILDWMLPDLDGLSVLRTWRSAGLFTPVLMCTARGTVPEKVQGLRAGADDYLVKPFDFEELLARIEALHRRSEGASRAHVVGGVSLDPRRRTLSYGDQHASLTAREYSLAAELFEHAGDVLTRSQLLERVWGSRFDGEPNVVDVYVGYLRRKLSDLGAEQVNLRTVRGIGFCLEKVRSP